MNLELRIKNIKNNHKSSIINRQFRSGFTLIELLIVIAIIGILAAILMANFVGVRQRARDAQRKSDLRQIQSALEFYRSDVGNYPPSPLYAVDCTAYTSSSYASISNGTTIYLNKIPCNPSASGGTYDPATKNYYYTSGGTTTYTISTCLENTQDKDPNSTTPSSNCSSGIEYNLSQP